LRRDARGPLWYTAQWNDDIHHALHVLITNETDGYYSDYAQKPLWQLGRCLAEGYAYQGEPSAFRDGSRRGEASKDLPPTCFVSFLQNHDQIGNRALGERITQLADAKQVKLAMAILLLAPSPPLLFMGEEFAASTPFLFFCDFGPELADPVTQGRRHEFARFEQFRSPQAQARIPDPNAEKTFMHSKLDWNSTREEAHGNWLDFYRDVLKCRREKVVPRIKDIAPGSAKFEIVSPAGLQVQWFFANSGNLQLIANFDHKPLPIESKPQAKLLYSTALHLKKEWKEMPPLTAAWFLNA
jgi:maltooligosyltrehalose trehalohydrolase